MNEHIVTTPGICGGKPRITGRRITVQNIAVWHERMGKGADEIVSEYGLTLADVYSALAYYFDYRDQIDLSIADGQAMAQSPKAANSSKVRAKNGP